MKGNAIITRTYEPGERVYVEGENSMGTVTADAGFFDGWDAGVAVRVDSDGEVLSCAHAQISTCGGIHPSLGCEVHDH